MYTKIEDLVGKTFVQVAGAPGKDTMRFTTAEGVWFEFYHSQECCESVAIADVCGDLGDLVGSPIVLAEEVSSEGAAPPKDHDSCTWTFYRFATVKGTVTVRWLGESSGYYSEDVYLRSGGPS